MAFEFDLEDSLPMPICDAMGVEIVEFALGYDVDQNHAIIMSVMLVPIKSAHDIRFGIRERDLAHEWKVTAPDYSIAKVRRYIPKDKRPQVLALLLDALQVLLNKTKPKSLTMETAFGNLPSSAIAKYGAISTAVTQCGFELDQRFRDEISGKDYWSFTPQGTA